jgi:hypothetical protein
MAQAKKTEQQEIEEELIDIGDEEEEEVDIEFDEKENPNIVDQLQAVPEEGEQKESEQDERSAEEKLNEFLEAHPDVSDLRSKDIKGRIDKLTWQMKEAERQRDAATQYAQNVQKENLSLKSRQQHQDGVFINEHKARLEAQLATAKEQLKDAHEAGDTDLIADAQTLLSKTVAELSQAEQTETRFQRYVQSTPSPEQDVQPYYPPQSQAPAPQVDPKAEAWAKRNEWFGEDEEMTQAALSIHETLVTQEGYIPTGNGYYAELDSRMRKNYPNYFSEKSKPELQGNQMVTPPSSASSSRTPRGKRNVRLTPSQVAIAKKLGVPLEEYAKYVV